PGITPGSWRGCGSARSGGTARTMRSPRRRMKSSSPSGASASTRSTRSTSKVRPRHLAGRCTLKPQDPHSPQVYGIHRVLWLGVVLYVEESAKPETVEHYG